MDPAIENADAVAVSKGKIVAVGAAVDINKLRGPDTEQVDLSGRTLLPGFIDGHSHFTMAVKSATWANVSGAPVGKVDSIASLLDELQVHAQKQDIAVGDWVVAYGYDAATLSDARELNRDDLDSVFPNNPVVIIHVSFHGAVLNSKAFEAINYDESTPTPEGGVIVRRAESNEPLGLLM